jgi:hypothetical protein
MVRHYFCTGPGAMLPRGRSVTVVVLCCLLVILSACASRTDRSTARSPRADLKSSQKPYRGSDSNDRIAATGPRTSRAKTENPSQVNPSNAASHTAAAKPGLTKSEPAGTMVWSLETHIPANAAAVAPAPPPPPEQGHLLSRADDAGEAGDVRWARIIAILSIAAIVIGVIALRRPRMVT